MPREYQAAYIASNIVAVVVLALAFRRPNWVRLLTAGLFAWAFTVNAHTALVSPLDYQGFADLAVLPWYRDFIRGWFREHTAWLLLPIAFGQLTIAGLLLGSRKFQRIGIAGAMVFLLAIAPLGVGSAFPFSLTYSVALIAYYARSDRKGREHVIAGVAAPT